MTWLHQPVHLDFKASFHTTVYCKFLLCHVLACGHSVIMIRVQLSGTSVVSI